MRQVFVGLLLVPLAACGHTPAGTSQEATSSALPTSVVSGPTPAEAPYLVAPPMLAAPAGPGPAERHRPCGPADVTATAASRAIVGGVAAVVRLRGSGCSLHITAGPHALLDAAGTQLAVRLDDAVSAVNPPRIPRYDIPLGAGDALWGFTWTGSWCGPKAATVVIPMTDDPRDPAAKGPYGDLRVPLTGPQPPCTGVSRSALRPGVAGAPGGPTWPADPVLPAPADWAGLSATLTLPATSPSGLVPAAVFTLLNRTGAAITLSPCPEYAVFIATDQTDLATRGVLGCSGHGTVPAHGATSFSVPAQSYADGDPRGGPAPGTAVTVRVAIAGVPTATAITRTR